VTPLVKDRYQRIVARVKCIGTNVNAEQVNRGTASNLDEPRHPS